MDLIADTSFLVGLWRRQPWALDFAKGNPGKTLGIPWVVRGEFRHGAVRAGHDEAEVERFLALGLPLDEPGEIVMAYALIAAGLQENHPDVFGGIGQNDLWIAAVAVHAGLPLLTRNRRHFERIEGLSLHVLEP
jgi:predicted nucleic acid-binding protein